VRTREIGLTIAAANVAFGNSQSASFGVFVLCVSSCFRVVLILLNAEQYGFVWIFHFRHFEIYSRTTLGSANVVMNQLYRTKFYAKFRKALQ